MGVKWSISANPRLVTEKVPLAKSSVDESFVHAFVDSSRYAADGNAFQDLY